MHIFGATDQLGTVAGKSDSGLVESLFQFTLPFRLVSFATVFCAITQHSSHNTKPGRRVHFHFNFKVSLLEAHNFVTKQLNPWNNGKLSWTTMASNVFLYFS